MNPPPETLPAPVAQAEAGPMLFGHPRRLATLVFTEMWERLTYYGLQSILILFMVAASGRGGLGFGDQSGNAIAGLYIGGTYLLSLIGGWVSDRLIGGRQAVLSGDYDAHHLATLPALYLRLFWWSAIGGTVMLLVTPRVKRLMAGVT